MVVPALKLTEEQTYEETVAREVCEAPVQRRTRRVSPYVVLPVIGLLLLGAGLSLVQQRVQLMTLTYELETARQQLTSLQQTNARLQASVAGATSLDKMETTARTRLGMVTAGARTSIVLTPETQPETMIAENPSAWAQAGAWLQERLSTTAEAGERPVR